MAIAIMRTGGGRSFFERPLYLASDGWAYEQPVRKRQTGRKLVRRYPHDGGTQTLDSAVQEIEWGAVDPSLRSRLLAAFRRFYR